MQAALQSVLKSRLDGTGLKPGLPPVAVGDDALVGMWTRRKIRGRWKEADPCQQF